MRLVTMALVVAIGSGCGIVSGTQLARVAPRVPPKLMDRRSALSAAAAGLALAAAPQDAAAWCGSEFPSWAYYLQWDELTTPIKAEEPGQPSLTPFRRVVGDVRKERKAGVVPVVTMPLPGAGYSYFENLEAMSVSDRRVVELSGDGANERTLAGYAQAVAAVCRSLEAPAVHLVAHGLAAPAALLLLERASVPVRSLTLVSPYGAPSDLKPAARDALLSAAEAPPRLKDSGLAPQLLAARLSQARSTCIAESIGGDAASLRGWLDATLLSSQPIPLGDAALAARLRALPALPPVYLAYGGDSDIVAPEWAELPSGVTVRRYASSGHIPFVDQPEEFVRDLLDFFDAADGVVTNRELKFTNPLKGY